MEAGGSKVFWVTQVHCHIDRYTIFISIATIDLGATKFGWHCLIKVVGNSSAQGLFSHKIANV